MDMVGMLYAKQSLYGTTITHEFSTTRIGAYLPRDILPEFTTTLSNGKAVCITEPVWLESSDHQ